MKITPKNIEFYSLLLTYTKKVFALLKSQCNINEIQLIQNFKWIYAKDYTYRREFEIKKYWPDCFMKFKKQFCLFPEYNKLIDVIGKNYIAKETLNLYPFTIESGSPIGGASIINFIPYRLLVEKDSFVFSLNRFNYYYSLIEKQITSEFIEHERITILQGLILSKDNVKFNKNMEIGKLKPVEILDMLNRDIPIGRETFNQHFDLNYYAIKYKYKTKKENKKEDEQKIKAAFLKNAYERNEQMALNLLRIFKSGKFLPILNLFGNDVLLTKTYSWLLLNQPDHWIYDPYRIDQSELVEIKRLFQKTNIRQLCEHQALYIALNRFSQALDRKSIEDRVIDFSICAEALFLGDNQGTLKQRLATKTSCLIGTDEIDKQKINTNMKSFYKLRSQIIHGTGPNYELPARDDGTKFRLNEFVVLIENYLRMSLLNAVNIAINKRLSRFEFSKEGTILG